MNNYMIGNYLFRDKDTGEEFYVRTDSLEMAKEIAAENFNNPVYLNIIDSDFTAEMMGLDTY